MRKLKKINLHFATFADGNGEIISAGERLIGQAVSAGIFSTSSLHNKKYLEEILDESLVTLISPATRGFGYWIWKPLLINELLEKVVKENEILVYTDAGTELNFNFLSKIKFLKFVELTKNQPILAFNTREPEYKFTKAKCLNFLLNRLETETFQVEATTILIRNCENSRMFVKKWATIACSENFSIIDDSTAEEHDEFIDHRHDQSIFSVLYKNNSYKAFKLNSPGYSDNPKSVSTFQRLAFNSFAFWQIRNRSGVSLVRPWQSKWNYAILSLPFYSVNRPLYFSVRFMKRVYFFLSNKLKKA